MTLRLLTRSEWGKRQSKAKKIIPHPMTSQGRPVDTVVLHHSVTPDGPFVPILQSIERGHQAGEFFDIAYNAAVSNRQSVAADCRGPLTQGGATGNGMDQKSLSICAIGDFHTAGKDAPSTILVDNLVDLIRLWISQGFVSPSFQLRKHSDFKATACCGARLEALIPEIERRVKEGGHRPPSGMSDAQKLEAIANILAS